MAGPAPEVLNSDPRTLGERLKLYFGTGLLLLLPIAVTFFILRLVFDFLDSILQPIFEAVLGVRIPGIGLAALVLLVLAVGMIGSARLGSRAVATFQGLLLKLPLVRNIYSATTQLMDIFSGSRTEDDAKRVVIIEYPRPGSWAIGFLMAVTMDENRRTLGAVYVPTAPMPNSGWVALVPLSDVYETDLSVQQVSQIVFSAGLLVPHDLPKRPIQQRMVDSLQEQLVSQREELEARRREIQELQERMGKPELSAAELETRLQAERFQRDTSPPGGQSGPSPRESAPPRERITPPPKITRSPSRAPERTKRRSWWHRLIR